MQKKEPKVLLIIPAYNEEENILNTYNSILEYNKKNNTNYDVLVINDGSTDNTEKILDDNRIPHIELIHNLGIGGAVQTGYKFAYNNCYDIAVQFDGDGQHDINYVKDIIKPIIENKCDMCIGSRFISRNTKGFKSTPARRMGINIISFNIKLKTKKKIYDTTSGFRAINKNIIKLFADYYSTEYPEPISTVRVINHGYKVLEVPVVMRERQGGTSSISSWKKAYYMINVILSILLSRKGGKNNVK